jgi:hypothetical protein
MSAWISARPIDFTYALPFASTDRMLLVTSDRQSHEFLLDKIRNVRYIFPLTESALPLADRRAGRRETVAM